MHSMLFLQVLLTARVTFALAFGKAQVIDRTEYYN